MGEKRPGQALKCSARPPWSSRWSKERIRFATVPVGCSPVPKVTPRIGINCSRWTGTPAPAPGGVFRIDRTTASNAQVAGPIRDALAAVMSLMMASLFSLFGRFQEQLKLGLRLGRGVGGGRCFHLGLPFAGGGPDSLVHGPRGLRPLLVEGATLVGGLRRLELVGSGLARNGRSARHRRHDV